MPVLTQQEVAERTRARGYGFYLFAVSLILLCAQGIFYLLLLDSTVGRFSFLSKQPPPDPSLVRSFRVVILKSQATAHLFAENPNGYFRRERYWEDMLSGAGVPFQVVAEYQLPSALRDASALVLPGVSCLGPKERQVIREFLRSGKGIVASGPTGSRDGNCAWQGWDFLQRLTGASGFTAVTQTRMTYAALAGQRPYSGGVPAGSLLDLPSQEFTVITAASPDALITDWRLRDDPAFGKTRAGLAAHQMVDKGRVVWFGFSEAVPPNREEAQQMFDNYALTAVKWVGQQPLAYLADWPNHKPAAVIVAESVHASYTNAEQTAVLLSQKKLPATFILSSAEAAAHPSALQAFAAAGEIASAGDIYTAIGGQPARIQSQRLLQARQALDRISRQSVVGFAAPFGTADNATVVALNDSGYRYYLNEVAISRAVPEIIEFSQSSRMLAMQKGQLSRIFRTGSEDVEMVAAYRGPSPPGPELAESFLGEFQKIASLGGLYALYFHDYLLGAPEYRATLNRILEGIKAQDVWAVTGRDLVAWWSSRQRVQVTVKKLSPHRLQLDVASMADADMENVSVYVYLPYRPQKVEIRSTMFRLEAPQFEMMKDDDLLRVDIRTLKGQTDYNYIISLDE